MPRPAGALNSASRSAQVRWPLSIFLLFLLVLAQKTFTWLLGGPAAAAPRVLGRTARPGRRVRVVGARVRVRVSTGGKNQEMPR